MINWQDLQKENDSIIEQLSAAGLDKKKRSELQKRSSQLSTLLELNKHVINLEEQREQAAKQAVAESGELKELFEQEVTDLNEQLTQLEKQLQDTLYPPDERDTRSAFLEIRAGAGGQEAALFVADMYKMYSMYAQRRGWDISIVATSHTDIGGYKELTAHIKGKNVFKYLKFESGVHRVQRVPATETQGRVHTSTVTVAVLPEADEVDVSIAPSDLRIDVYRASGAGGQHVNTTDSAVRITHIPTGVVVTCQDERSQIKNKNKAMKELRARIVQAEEERLASERSEARKSQVGSGMRAEKIRTYNFPQNRVSDHRINLTLKKLDLVMQGDLDDLFNPLSDWDRQERRKQAV